MFRDPDTRRLATIAALFLLLPILFYLTSGVPHRSALKEALSLLTLLCFALVIGQAFLARSNTALRTTLPPPKLQKLHKWIGYGALSVLLLHPFLIVLPRYFEAGIGPLDALVTMITTWETPGIVLGLAAWVLLLVLGLTSHLRMTLIRRYRIRYRGWRYFHGGLAIAFLGLSLWHAIDLGRHMSAAMASYFLLIALLGGGALARLYIAETPRGRPQSEGAKP